MKLKQLSIAILFLLFALSARSQWIMLDSLGSPVLDIQQSGQMLIACTGVSGVYISNDSGFTWSSANVGLTNLNTRKIAVHDSLLVLATSTGIFKSTNLCQTWTFASNGLPALNVTGIIIRGDSIIISSYGGIFLSMNQCQTWTILNNGFPDLYRSCLIDNGGRLFAGSESQAGVYASDDNGLTWVLKSDGIAIGPYSTTGYVSANSFTRIGQTLFVSTQGRGVYRSDDNGENWIWLNIPNYWVWIVSNTNGTLLTGHDGTGFCKSNDYGGNWTILNEGLSNFLDMQIRTICSFNGYIYIGTGSGSHKIYRRQFTEITVSTQNNELKQTAILYPNPVTNESRFVFNDSQSTLFTIQIFNGQGTLLKELTELTSESFVLKNCEYAKGLYFYRITTSNRYLFSGKFLIL